MAKRVALVLSGCGARDGTDAREATLLQLSLERQGAEIEFYAPDVPLPRPFNHQTGAIEPGARSVLAESARLAGAPVASLATLDPKRVDAVAIPGGEGAGTVLSNYADKGVVCDVHPDLVRLFKTDLATHRPMAFIGLSAILAARVLGPVAGVRVTLGTRGTPVFKHASVMGADVRLCPLGDIILDQKTGVISTPGHLHDEARLPQIADSIHKLVRQLLSMAKDRNPAPPPPMAA